MRRSGEPLAIVGAGIGGLSAAVALQGHGIPVLVLERASCATPVGAGISLWPNAVQALDALGVGAAVRARGERVLTSTLRTCTGRTLSELDLAALSGDGGAPLLMIHRADLHDVLAAALAPGVVRYGCELCDYSVKADCVEVKLAGGASLTAVALIGADGVASRVRTKLLPGHEPRDHDVVAVRAVIDSIALGRGSAFEAWGDGMVFGAAPLSGSRVYWYAAAGRRTIEASEQRLAAQASPTPDLLAATPREARLRHPIRTVPALPCWSEGRVALLGDAAHAMVPNLGQGGAQAIEDAVALAGAVAGDLGDIPRALAVYNDARRPRAMLVQRASDRMARIAMLRGVRARVRNAAMRHAPAASRRRALERIICPPPR